MSLQPFTKPARQNGLEGTLYGDQPFVQTEYTQGEPPAGLGYLAATNNLFSATTGDGPTPGYEEDNWKPIWKEPWFQAKSRQQMWDWNTVNTHSAREEAFRYNQGVVFYNPGAPYTLPKQSDRPRAHHKLKKPLF